MVQKYCTFVQIFESEIFTSEIVVQDASGERSKTRNRLWTLSAQQRKTWRQPPRGVLLLTLPSSTRPKRQQLYIISSRYFVFILQLSFNKPYITSKSIVVFNSKQLSLNQQNTTSPLYVLYERNKRARSLGWH